MGRRIYRNVYIVTKLCHGGFREHKTVLEDTYDVRPVTGRGDGVESCNFRVVGARGGLVCNRKQCVIHGSLM